MKRENAMIGFLPTRSATTPQNREPANLPAMYDAPVYITYKSAWPILIYLNVFAERIKIVCIILIGPYCISLTQSVLAFLPRIPAYTPMSVSVFATCISCIYCQERSHNVWICLIWVMFHQKKDNRASSASICTPPTHIRGIASTLVYFCIKSYQSQILDWSHFSV